MEEKVSFSEPERAMIRQYLDTERVTSFSQTIWPFIFFFIPSFFIFILFLGDGRIGTAAVAYGLLCFPYFLSMHSARSRMRLFSSIVTKYEQRLRGQGQESAS